MIESTDTLWNYFTGRIATINPARLLGGYLDAQDWPPKQVDFDKFYMLVLGDVPLDEETFSWNVPFYETTVQFMWMNMGTQISNYTNVMGKNRGDRIRTCYQMKQELLQAMFPGFTNKISLSVDAAQNLQTTTLQEQIWWSKPAFNTRVDRESGLLYGTATVKIGSMAPTIAA